MDLPADLLLTPVEGHDDLIRFNYGFTLDAKALPDGTDSVVTETEDGDLIIEGMAAVFDGLDRQGENFAPGAFQRGIKSFLAGQSALCFNHKHDLVLGKVLDLKEIEGKGLHMKARVDGAIKNHPVLGTLYQQIKRGTINGLSVGGFFKRALVDGGPKIVDMDFTEISTTATPVHPGTHFSVLAGKALSSDLYDPEHLDVPTVPEDKIRDEDFYRLNDALITFDVIFARIKKRGEDDANPTTTTGDVTDD